MDTRSTNMFKRILKGALIEVANDGLAQNVTPYTARDLQAAFAPNLFNKANVPADDLPAQAAFGLKSVGPVATLATPNEIVLSIEVTRYGCRNGDFEFLVRMHVKATGKVRPSVKYSALACKLAEVSDFAKQLRTALGLTPASMAAFLTAACDSPARRARQNKHTQKFQR